jgi:biopolymer transport protein ExbD
MRRSIVGLAAGLALMLASAPAVAAASVPAANRPVARTAVRRIAGVSIGKDGRLVFRNAGGRVLRTLPVRVLTVRTASCSNVGSTVEIGADPQLDYAIFMVVANWLQDCKVHHLVLIGDLAGQPVRARLEEVDVAEPLPMRICQDVGCTAPPRLPTFLSLTEPAGLLSVSLDSGAMKQTNLTALAGDLREATNAADPASTKIYVRADRHIPFAQFLALLDQLDRDGYANLALINELYH